MPVKLRKPKDKNFVVTPAMVEAFRSGDRETLRILCGIRPWMPDIEDVDTPHPPAWDNSSYRDFWYDVRVMRVAIEKAARVK